MNGLLDRTWDWRVLTRECPACGAVVPEDSTQSHKAWHWLTNTEPREIEVSG